MALDTATFTKYQQIVSKDPKSKLFAALAEAYRERGDLAESERLARQGLKHHVDYVAGYVVLGKVLIAQKKRQEASEVLQRAVELNPEHLVAYQILADNWTELGDLDQALKAHKMALFLNPLNEKSRIAVEKLEVLSAQQYESDVFQLKTLSPNSNSKGTRSKSLQNLGDSVEASFGLGDEGYTVKKALALIDAFIVRGDLESARQQLAVALNEAPAHAELLKRQLILNGEEDQEVAEPLAPIPLKEDLIIQRKLRILQRVLDLNTTFFTKRRKPKDLPHP